MRDAKGQTALGAVPFAEISDADPTELFCKDFDTGCLTMTDPIGCKRGKAAVIDQICYYTEPVRAICPIGDGLR
jgi:hypothetical protein